MANQRDPIYYALSLKKNTYIVQMNKATSVVGLLLSFFKGSMKKKKTKNARNLECQITSCYFTMYFSYLS